MIYCLQATMTPVRVKLTTFIIKINGYWILAAISGRRGDRNERKRSASLMIEEDVNVAV